MSDKITNFISVVESMLDTIISRGHRAPRDPKLENELLHLDSAGLISTYLRTVDNKAINEMSPKFRLAAVTASGSALANIDTPTEAEMRTAMKRHWFALQYIKNPSHEIQELALQNMPLYSIEDLLRYCGYDQSPKVQMAAIMQDPENINHIHKPTNEVIEYIKKHAPELEYAIRNPRSYLLNTISYKENTLSWLQSQHLAAESELARFEDSMKAIPSDELTPDAMKVIKEFVAQKSKAAADAKLDYDKAAADMKWYQDHLAKLPVQESAELKHIKILSGLV